MLDLRRERRGGNARQAEVCDDALRYGRRGEIVRIQPKLVGPMVERVV